MKMKKILSYLYKTYAPETVLLYGSYADGTNGEGSDFDALLIAPGEARHDNSVVEGVPLDVWVYPPETFMGDFAPEEFVQVLGGTLVLDAFGQGAKLLGQVEGFVSSLPPKTLEERQEEVAWCRKMLERTKRQDAEGVYRWHWLLCDSLEIWCDVAGLPYLGPKKSLKTMEKKAPEGYALYEGALREFSFASLQRWVKYLERCLYMEQEE